MSFPAALNASDLTPGVGFTITSRESNFGTAVAGLGDINDDGKPDLMVGVAGIVGDEKAAYVIFGNSSLSNYSNAQPLTTSALTAGAGFKLTSFWDYFGISCSAIGDVNNDGKPDFIVGTGAFAKTAYVIFGSSNLSKYSSASPLDMSALTAGIGFRITRSSSGLSNLGWSVAGLGDINDDGKPDFIVGDNRRSEVGVIFGNSSLSSYSNASPLDISTLAAGVGFRITNDNPSTDFGWSVAGVGDINDDGKPDLIIGACNAGKAYVIFGNSSLSKYSSAKPLETIALTAGVGFAITSSSTGFGCAVTGAGDVNGDGKPDLLIGAYTSNKAYVIFGGSSLSNYSNANPLNTSALTVGVGFKITSSSTGFGNSVAVAGDLNADGKPDLVIEANGAGISYVIFVSSSLSNYSDANPLDTSAITAGAGFSFTTPLAGSAFGTSVAGVGDMNGDGKPDLAIGADRSSRTYVIFGSESSPSPAPAPFPSPPPIPSPSPSPAPEPMPAPQPLPQPQPAPEPLPMPVPAPAPFPSPSPIPMPSPSPVPEPMPAPQPLPQPQPVPEPLPLLMPVPAPQLFPQPQPAPEPMPAPAPFPSLSPIPMPASIPELFPLPEPSEDSLSASGVLGITLGISLGVTLGVSLSCSCSIVLGIIGCMNHRASSKPPMFDGESLFV